MAVLIPCLVALRDEFNQLAPKRDKASDGWIGNTAHAGTSSDHNPDETGNTPYEDADDVDEVHAIDVDNTGPWPGGMTFDLAVNVIVDRHRRGLDDRLQNVIWNGRIASRSWGWTWQSYDGASAHTEHAHFSARYTTAQERDTSPWGLVDRFGDEHMEQSEFTALLKGALKDLELKKALAMGIFATDNVVSLDGPDPSNTKDASVQALIQWPRAGYAKTAADKATTANDRIAAVESKVDLIIAKLEEQGTEQPPPPPAGTTAAKSSTRK